MITDTDTKKLITAFKKVFTTKDDLKEQLRDQKEQILDAVDGKLANQKEEVIKGVGEYVADIIVPMFDERDKKISRIEKKLNLPALVD